MAPFLVAAPHLVFLVIYFSLSTYPFPVSKIEPESLLSIFPYPTSPYPFPLWKSGPESLLSIFPYPTSPYPFPLWKIGPESLPPFIILAYSFGPNPFCHYYCTESLNIHNPAIEIHDGEIFSTKPLSSPQALKLNCRGG